MIIRSRMPQSSAPENLYTQARAGLEQAFANVHRYDPASQARMYAMANYLDSIRPDQFDPSAAVQVQQAASRPVPMVADRRPKSAWERSPQQVRPLAPPGTAQQVAQPVTQPAPQAAQPVPQVPQVPQPVQQPVPQPVPQPAQVSQPVRQQPRPAQSQGIIAAQRNPWSQQDLAVQRHHAEVERMRQWVSQAQQDQRRQRQQTYQSNQQPFPTANGQNGTYGPSYTSPDGRYASKDIVFRPFPQQQATNQQPQQRQGNQPFNSRPAY